MPAPAPTSLRLRNVLFCRVQCPPYRAVVHQVVVAALLRGPADVLLCYRSTRRGSYPAVWDFPGGHVETGETPLNALCREVLEELGVRVQLEALSETPDLRVTNGALDLSLWAVRSWAGEPLNCAPEEHDRIEWFEIGQAISTKLAHAEYRAWLVTLLAEA